MDDENNLQQQDNRLLGDSYAALKDALETLYIKNNISGRIVFIKAWPSAAKYILGEEVIRFDTEGGGDREVRAILEEEAEERRLRLLEIVETLEERSVEKGVLQKEYVESVIAEFGTEIAALLYDAKILERVSA
jgi:hypothetical protein